MGDSSTCIPAASILDLVKFLNVCATLKNYQVIWLRQVSEYPQLQYTLPNFSCLLGFKKESAFKFVLSSIMCIMAISSENIVSTITLWLKRKSSN